jgi:hypothetical protein
MIGPQCNNQEMRGSEQYPVNCIKERRRQVYGISNRQKKGPNSEALFEAPYLYKVVNERRTTPAIV